MLGVEHTNNANDDNFANMRIYYNVFLRKEKGRRGGDFSLCLCTESLWPGLAIQDLHGVKESNLHY